MIDMQNRAMARGIATLVTYLAVCRGPRVNYTFKVKEFGLIIHESLLENKTSDACLKS